MFLTPGALHFGEGWESLGWVSTLNKEIQALSHLSNFLAGVQKGIFPCTPNISSQSSDSIHSYRLAKKVILKPEYLYQSLVFGLEKRMKEKEQRED